MPSPRRAAAGVKLTADHEGRIQPPPASRLAIRLVVVVCMRASHADAVAETHQLGGIPARGTTGMRAAWRPPPRDFGSDRAGNHHRVTVFDMPGVVPDPDLHAQPGQPARNRVLAQVGTAHAVAEVVQDLGDAAHTGAAGADKVYPAHPSHALRLGRGCGTHRQTHDGNPRLRASGWMPAASGTSRRRTAPPPAEPVRARRAVASRVSRDREPGQRLGERSAVRIGLRHRQRRPGIGQILGIAGLMIIRGMG
jgi:hypothetical protein